MKKTLKKLIEVENNDLKKEQSHLNHLYTQLENIENIIEKIDYDILKEKDMVDQNNLSTDEFLLFLKQMQMQKNNFLRDLKEIKIFIDESQDKITNHYSNTKKYEIYGDKLELMTKKMHEKSFQSLMDTYATVQFLKK